MLARWHSVYSGVLFLALSLLLGGCMSATAPRTANLGSLSLAPPTQTILPGYPPLTCRLTDGTAHFYEGWYDFGATSFTLQAGEKNFIVLPRQNRNSTTRLWITRAPNNQRLIFCPDELAGGKACRSIYAVDEDFRTGIVRTLDVPDKVRGSQVECRYAPATKSAGL